MWGVVLAPYALPTFPSSSSRIGYSISHFSLASVLTSSPCPCLPGAPELIASHTTSSFLNRSNVSFMVSFS